MENYCFNFIKLINDNNNNVTKLNLIIDSYFFRALYVGLFCKVEVGTSRKIKRKNLHL